MRFIVACVLVLLTAQPVWAGKVNLSKAAANAGEAGKILALIWQDPNDGESLRLQKSLADPVVRAYAFKHFNWTQLNAFGNGTVIGPQNKGFISAGDLALEMDIQQVPTIILLDGTGAEITRFEGAFSPRFLLAALMYIATGEYKDPQYRGTMVRWSRANSKRVREAYESGNIK